MKTKSPELYQTIKCVILNPLNPWNPLFDFTKIVTKDIQN